MINRKLYWKFMRRKGGRVSVMQFVIRTATEKPEDILAPLADLFIDHQMLAHAYYLLKELQKQMSDVADIQELVTELERYL